MGEDRSRDAAIWDAGYAVGYRHAMDGRPSILRDCARAPVIDLRVWRVEHVALANAQPHAN